MAEVQHSVVTEVHLTLSGAEASVLRAILGSLYGGVTPDGYRAMNEREAIKVLVKP